MTEPRATSGRAKRARPRRPRARAALLSAAAGALLVPGAALYVLAAERPAEISFGVGLANLREVDPGRFYRSGQLTGEQLREAIGELGIRTVINLRGHDTSQPWYREEARVTGELGVPLHNVHLSARSLPQPHEVTRLLDLYRDAERPILVHCETGADRTGEASAIYQIDYMGKTPEEALEMLSLRYRHLPWLRPAKRYFIERYRGEAWARSAYDPCAAGYDYYDRARKCS